MNILVFRVLAAAVGLLGFDLLYTGFRFGFPAFVALSTLVALLLWGYDRLVIQRARPAQNWRWEQFGSQLVRLEVA